MPDATPSRRAQPLTSSARLSLGNTTQTLSTSEHLRFQLDHALARDAVHARLDIPLLLRGLHGRNLETLILRSAAPDRATYLLRPDLGRTLHPNSIEAIQSRAPHLNSETWAGAATAPSGPPRLALILADGLSALALEYHALPLLDSLLPLIPDPCSLTPAVIATNARVALGDEIGHRLQASLTLLLIGERPGLSSPDSLGVYLTWNPRPGRTDAERNCISNIRGDAGLSYAEAAHRILHYVHEAHRLQTTGIALKDPITPTPSELAARTGASS